MTMLNAYDVVAISLGGGGACILDSAGVVRCWSVYNRYGKGGYGLATADTSGGPTCCCHPPGGAAYCGGSLSAANKFTPQLVSMGGVAASEVFMGTNNGCALLTDATLSCWGMNTCKCASPPPTLALPHPSSSFE